MQPQCATTIGALVLSAVVIVGCPSEKPATPPNTDTVQAEQPASAGSATSMPANHDTSSVAIDLGALFGMPDTPNDVVAKVNEATITRADLEHRLRQTQVQLGATGLPQSLTRYDVLDGALDDLIDRKLEEVLAEKLGATVDEKEVQAFLADLDQRMAQNPAFKAFLLRAGKDEAQRKKDAKAAVLRRGIVKKLRVKSEKELATAAREYYDKHKRDYTIKGGVQTWRIVIKAPRGMVQRNRDAARARAEEIHKAATKAPDKFENLAKTNSEGGKRNEGGYIGFVAKGQYNAEMEKAIFSGKPGQVLPLYEDAQGFQILKVGERREGRVVPFEEKKEEITNSVFGTVVRQRIREDLDKLRGDQKIVIDIPELAAMEAKMNPKKTP